MEKTTPRGDANTSQKGFTLIELSIVLVIIGLLVGGVIKGKDLIDNTKTTKFMQEAQAYQDAITAYEERYGADPFNDTADRFGTGATATSPEATERLRAAGLIGLERGQNAVTDAAAEHVFGDTISFEQGGATVMSTLGTDTDTVVCFEGVPSEAAAATDAKYDDGISNTGNIRAATEATAGTRVLTPATASFGTTTATVCALAN